jgi:hypothetical protein
MIDDPFGICLEPECADGTQQELPSNLKMMKELLKSGKDILAGAADGVFVTKEVREERLKICYSCEFFIHASERCTKCGCFMETKTLFKQTKCPIDKWGKV